VVEGARLESVFRGNSNVGSNPTLSARNWPVTIEGGTYKTNMYGAKGSYTTGTYQPVLNALKTCRLTF
jgi:hypothetical protein